MPETGASSLTAFAKETIGIHTPAHAAAAARLSV